MYSEKEAEAPARMAVVVSPMVWRTRAELGVRAAIVAVGASIDVAIEEISVVIVC